MWHIEVELTYINNFDQYKSMVNDLKTRRNSVYHKRTKVLSKKNFDQNNDKTLFSLYIDCQIWMR